MDYSDEDPELLTIDAIDIPVDSLAPSLNNYENALSTVMSVPSKTDIVLSNVYDALNQKYNLNITNKEFTDFISTVIDKSKFETSIENIVGSKVITNVCDRVVLKSIITAGALIEKSLEVIEKQSATINTTSAELIIMISKIFEWVEQLDALRDKYETEDPDKSLSRVIETKENEINGNVVSGNSESSKNATKLIKDILDQLNNK
jgi:hypothetical protein